MSNDELLTADEIAQWLKVSTPAAYAMMAPGGALSHLTVRVSKKTVRIYRDDLEKHLKEIKGAEHAAS